MHVALPENRGHRKLQFAAQQLAARVVLVRAVAMAGLAGDEDDFFRLGGGLLGESGRGNKSEYCSNEERERIGLHEIDLHGKGGLTIQVTIAGAQRGVKQCG